MIFLNYQILLGELPWYKPYLDLEDQLEFLQNNTHKNRIDSSNHLHLFFSKFFQNPQIDILLHLLLVYQIKVYLNPLNTQQEILVICHQLLPSPLFLKHYKYLGIYYFLKIFRESHLMFLGNRLWK